MSFRISDEMHNSRGWLARLSTARHSFSYIYIYTITSRFRNDKQVICMRTGALTFARFTILAHMGWMRDEKYHVHEAPSLQSLRGELPR